MARAGSAHLPRVASTIAGLRTKQPMRVQGSVSPGVFMSIVRVQVSLVVCTSLASIAGTAQGQVSPTPPPDGAPAPTASPAPPAPTASPAPPAPPAAAPATPAPAPADTADTGPADDAPWERAPIAYSAQLELLPVGTLHLQAPGQSQPLEVDTVTAYGVSGSFEYLVTPYAAFGVNPGVVLGLKADGDKISSTQYDVRARARLGKLSDDGFGAHVYGSLGASWIVSPGDTPTFFGTVAGFGVAVSHPVEHAAFITIEVGYQFGFQSTTVNNADVEASSRLFHIALGIGSYLW